LLVSLCIKGSVALVAMSEQSEAIAALLQEIHEQSKEIELLKAEVCFWKNKAEQGTYATSEFATVPQASVTKTPVKSPPPRPSGRRP
jgi:hypothetical protein